MMTHTRQFDDSEGRFGAERASTQKCTNPLCEKLGPVVCRVWESSDGAYEDYQYRCTDCGRVWWVDGIDS